MNIFTHKRVTSKLSKVYAGIRLSEDTHPYATEAAAVINKNPADTANWLVLADKLQEENEVAHHMIRALFAPDYTPPTDFTGGITRSFRYFDNGGTYWDSRTVTCAEGKLWWHYYQNAGNCKTEVTPETAREYLCCNTSPHGEYENLTVTGELPATGGILPPGTKVLVTKPDGVRVEHTTKIYLSVPADAKWHHEDKNLLGYGENQIKFDHEGYTVVCRVKDVQPT